MTVYIEYVILDNLIIDYLLLSSALIMARAKGGRWRIILASISGTAFAVFMPYMNFSPALLFIVKIFVGEIMVFVAGKFYSPGQFLRAFLFFLLFTFALGGVMIGLGYLWRVDFTGANGLSNLYKIAEVPFFAVFFGSFLGIKAIFRMFFQGKGEGVRAPYLRSVELIDGDSKTRLKGFIDTGNTLFDHRTGKPVSVINKALADKLYLSGKLKLRGVRFLPCSTINAEGKITVFEIDRLVIYSGEDRNIIYNATLGISPFECEGEEIILNVGLFGEV